MPPTTYRFRFLPRRTSVHFREPERVYQNPILSLLPSSLQTTCTLYGVPQVIIALQVCLKYLHELQGKKLTASTGPSSMSYLQSRRKEKGSKGAGRSRCQDMSGQRNDKVEIESPRRSHPSREPGTDNVSGGIE